MKFNFGALWNFSYLELYEILVINVLEEKFKYFKLIKKYIWKKQINNPTTQPNLNFKDWIANLKPRVQVGQINLSNSI